MTVAELDALPEAAARELLTACCGATPWVQAMLAARPWRDRDGLLAHATRAWETLSPAQLGEAIAHHPRLGETRAAATLTTLASEWSAGEQAVLAAAESEVRAALAQGNAEYERRFGHTFILCANGRTASEILAALQMRLENDAASELNLTADELHQITLLRLEKLLAGA